MFRQVTRIYHESSIIEAAIFLQLFQPELRMIDNKCVAYRRIKSITKLHLWSKTETCDIHLNVCDVHSVAIV